MRSIAALALKDLKLLYRDRFGVFWVLFFPLLMALFFGSIFASGQGGSRALTVAFSGTGDSTGVESFYRELTRSEGLTLQRMARDSAEKQVAGGKLVAAIHYTDTSSGPFGMFGPDRPSIDVAIDPSRRAEAGYLQGLVTQAYFTLLREKMRNPRELIPASDEQMKALAARSGLTADQHELLKGFLGQLDRFLASVGDGAPGPGDHSLFADPPVAFRDVQVNRQGPRSSWEITFPQALQWALIGIAAAFAIGLVTERTRGTYMRLRLAPITRLQILAGKGLACFLACMLSCAMLLAIGILVFGVRVTSPLGLIAALAAAGFCFVGLMMMISVLGRTEQAVSGAGWAILLVMSMTGGGMVPLVFLPSWMSTIGHFSAVKWSVLAAEGAIWRGFDAAALLTPIAVLLGFGAAALAIGVVVLSRSDR